MSYDPTQQVPPPQNYPPQNYPPPPPASQPPQAYPPPYTQQGYQPAPPTYPQYGTPPPPPGAGFDFNATWKKLGRSGQVATIGGLLLFILFFLSWFTVVITCTGSFCNVSKRTYDYSGFAVIGNIAPPNANESYSFPLMLVIILASLAVIALPIVGAMGKMPAKQVQLFMMITLGVAVLLEIVFMLSAFGAFPNETGTQTTLDTTVKVSVGPAFGFWLGFLVTLIVAGVYLYFGYLKKPGAVGGFQAPYQQALPYPGSQPQYPGSQPQYPGSQPQYQPPAQYPTPPPLPPTQYQPPPPPQYPGQPQPPYPGQ